MSPTCIRIATARTRRGRAPLPPFRVPARTPLGHWRPRVQPPRSPTAQDQTSAGSDGTTKTEAPEYRTPAKRVAGRLVVRAGAAEPRRGFGSGSRTGRYGTCDRLRPHRVGPHPKPGRSTSREGASGPPTPAKPLTGPPARSTRVMSGRGRLGGRKSRLSGVTPEGRSRRQIDRDNPDEVSAVFPWASKSHRTIPTVENFITQPNLPIQSCSPCLYTVFST